MAGHGTAQEAGKEPVTGLAVLIAVIVLVRAFSHGKWNR
jgi:hypothetical protein